MSKKEVVGSVMVVAALACLALWAFFFAGNHAVPVTGCVAEKIEVGTGYQRSIHVLGLEVGEELVYITTSARVYNSVVENGCYEFTGPRDGTSYNGVRAVEK